MINFQGASDTSSIAVMLSYLQWAMSITRKHAFTAVVVLGCMVGERIVRADDSSTSNFEAVYFEDVPLRYAISPSGHWLSFIQKENGEAKLFTRNIETGKGFQLTGVRGDIDQVIWIDDERLAVRTSEGGYSKLLQTDPQGKMFWDFTPVRNCFAFFVENQPASSVSGRLYFALIRSDGTQALYALLTRDNVSSHFPIVRVSKNPVQITEWLFSPDGSLVAGIGLAGSNRTLLVPEPNVEFNDQWVKKFEGPAEEFPRFTGYGVPRGFLLANGYFGTEHLIAKKFDIRDGTFGETVLDAIDSNIQEVIFSPDRQKIGAYLVHDKDPKYFPVTEPFALLRTQIERQIGLPPGHVAVPAAVSEDFGRAIVIEESPSTPSKFWHLDFQSKKSFLFFTPAKGVKNIPMQPMQSWNVAARDGLQLPCFTVSPAIVAEGSPIVLLIGGGPFEAIHQAWSPLLQYLSANGVTSVAMNYRGAPGFGRKFYLAGDGQASAGMITDVEDVVSAITQAPWAKNRKIVLVGISFGGFLAVRSVEKVGDQINAVALINPVLSIRDFFSRTLVNGATEEMALYERDKWFGSRSAEAFSRNLVFSDKLPLLVLQSSNDAKVSPLIAQEFVSAAKSRGSDANYSPLADGHDIENTKTWRELATQLLGFFKRTQVSSQSR